MEEYRYALEVTNIRKSFAKNEVLKGVTLKVKKGEIVGLVGANGAGKSTLMKIINGVYTSYSGEVRIDGTPITYTSPEGAAKSGVAMVYQELSLIPTMTVTQNLFLNNEILKSNLIDDAECLGKAREAFKEFGVDIDPRVKVRTLSVANQQIVEIVKAAMRRPSFLILDEPTASLTQDEINNLFELLRRLKSEGVAVIMVSHRLQEIMELCDRAVVLRDGVITYENEIKDAQLNDIIEAMIGGKVSSSQYVKGSFDIPEQAILEVRDLSWGNKLESISLKVYPGEIVGIAGLIGSGRTELLKNLYGLYKPSSGEIVLRGEAVQIKDPTDAINKGLFLVSEDRKKTGVIEKHSIRWNTLLPIWPRLKKGMLINDHKGRDITSEMIERLQIKSDGMESPVRRLSGGNQQKVVFAKSLATKPDLLLLDDPTVGIDIATKRQIAALIREITDEGKGVLLISSELDELASIADRILILKDGRFVKELTREGGNDITEKDLLFELLS